MSSLNMLNISFSFKLFVYKKNNFRSSEEADRHLFENPTIWFDKAVDVLNDVI